MNVDQSTPIGTKKRLLGVTAAVAASVALITSACGSSGGGSSATTLAPVTTAAPGGEPAYAKDLKPQLEKLVSDLLVPGTVVLIRSPELGDWTATFGTQTRGGTDPVSLADHIRIGSVTKTMTGTVILQLAQEGKLSLDDPVAKYRPDVPNGQHITITQLLNMRSGLYNYSESFELNEAMDRDPGKVYTPDDLLAVAFAHQPYFPPGESYHYSNTNTVLLGLIIEKVTGHTAADEFESRIFKPLGMVNTSMPAATSSAIPDPHPQGYQYGSNVETLEGATLSAEKQAQAKAGTLEPYNATDNNPSWTWTAGVGISTAEDLAAYASAMVGGGLLDEHMQKVRLDSIEPVDPTVPDSPGYGLGLAKFGALYGHTGEIPGYNTFMGYDPARKLTIVVWSSLVDSPNGQAPATTMARAIIEDLYTK